VIAASLGYRDIHNLTPRQVEKITQAHLLLAMFNAWQPGVFALSGWDLCGTLPLDPALVADLTADGDTRWLHRGAYDLMNYRPDGGQQTSSLPRGDCLYGPLPAQLADPASFASRLRHILKIRRECAISTGTQLDIADTSDAGLLAMVHELDGGRLQATLLNFSARPVAADVTSRFLPPGALIHDASRNSAGARVDRTHTFHITMLAHQGRSVLIDR
jgi:trehalose synthase